MDSNGNARVSSMNDKPSTHPKARKLFKCTDRDY